VRYLFCRPLFYFYLSYTYPTEFLHGFFFGIAIPNFKTYYTYTLSHISTTNLKNTFVIYVMHVFACLLIGFNY